MPSAMSYPSEPGETVWTDDYRPVPAISVSDEEPVSSITITRVTKL